MRKYLLAASIGAVLIAGQAAASDGAVVNLGDRIGGPADQSSSQFQGVGGDQTLLLLLLGGAFIGLIVWGVTQSSHSSSP